LAAICEGNEAMVRLLVYSKVDVNARDGKYGNALLATVSLGDEAVVVCLWTAGPMSTPGAASTAWREIFN